MGYGQGALIEGAVDGYRKYERDTERKADRVEAQQDRTENRKVRALQRERIEGQVGDERKARGRQDAYETDPAITGAADAVSYYRAKRDKALQLGDTAEFERVNEKLTAAEQKAFTKDYEKSMRRFIGTEGADYKGLVETYNKHWSDGVTLDMVRNEDGSYDMTFTREGEEPATTKAKDWEAVGKVAMRMADPQSWLKMKDAEAKELLKRRTKRDEIAAKGEEDRKTVRVKGEEARSVANIRATRSGGLAGDPAAVRTAKWQIDRLTKAINPATKKPYTESEATQIVLKADRDDITAKDKLRHIGALRRSAMPGDDPSKVESDLDRDIGMATGGDPDDPLGLRK
jgi:hypothetical protein